MTAYLVVRMKFHDLAWAREYQAKVPEIIRRYGGEYVARGNRVERFEGTDDGTQYMAILSYPSLARIREFMDCDDYAPFRDARIAQTYSDIIGFEADE